MPVRTTVQIVITGLVLVDVGSWYIWYGTGIEESVGLGLSVLGLLVLINEFR